jgi:hypothetical protein
VLQVNARQAIGKHHNECWSVGWSHAFCGHMHAVVTRMHAYSGHIYREVWPGWPSRSLLLAIENLTLTPQIPSAHTASAAPTATSCTMLMTVGCWWLQLTSVPKCPLPKRKPLCAGCCPKTVQSKNGVPYTQPTCKLCGSGVDNEHHLLLECRHSVLAVIRSEHRTLFDVIGDMRKLMAAGYKPELATILGSCMQGILQGLEAGLTRQPIINTSFLGRCKQLNKYHGMLSVELCVLGHVGVHQWAWLFQGLPHIWHVRDDPEALPRQPVRC